MRFKTKIMGFDCYVDVIHYSPFKPAKLTGAMEDAEEAIPAEFDYSIYDMDGTYWLELEDSVTEQDEIRLIEEYEAAVLADKYGKDF